MRLKIIFFMLIIVVSVVCTHAGTELPTNEPNLYSYGYTLENNDTLLDIIIISEVENQSSFRYNELSIHIGSNSSETYNISLYDHEEDEFYGSTANSSKKFWYLLYYDLELNKNQWDITISIANASLSVSFIGQGELIHGDPAPDPQEPKPYDAFLDVLHDFFDIILDLVMILSLVFVVYKLVFSEEEHEDSESKYLKD